MRHLALTAMLMLAAAPAIADPVHDSIAKALAAYDAGDMRTAKQQLDIASQQLAQRNAQLLATVLPRPYAGWTADKPEIVGIGNILGGAISAKCSYHSGNKTVNVSIVGDSPLLSAFMVLMSNPQIAMMSGNRVVNIGNNQALITPQGEIQMAFASRWYITVDGNAPVNEKQAYLTAVNFRALQQFR